MPFPERDNLGDGFHSDYASLIVNVSTIGKLIILRIILEKKKQFGKHKDVDLVNMHNT